MVTRQFHKLKSSQVEISLNFATYLFYVRASELVLIIEAF